MDPIQAQKSFFVLAGQDSSECLFHSDFQDLCLINPDASFFKISSIRVHLNLTMLASLITGIEFSYINMLTGAVVQGRPYQGTQRENKIEEVKLGNDEFITGVYGNCQNHIHRLVFRTSRLRVIEFGRAQKQEFSVEETERTHLTAARVGTAKAVRFIIFDKAPIRSGTLNVLPITINFTEPVPRHSLGVQIIDCRRLSDFRLFDSMNLSVFFIKVEQIFFEFDVFGITSIRFSYTDVNNMKYRGTEIKGTLKTTEKKRVGLENYEFLVAVKAFSSKTHILGLQLSLSTGKVIEVGNLLGGSISEMIAPIDKHLTCFEASISRYCESLSAFSAPIGNFNMLFGSISIQEQSVRVIEEEEITPSDSQENKKSKLDADERKTFLFGAGSLARSKGTGGAPSEMAVYFDDMTRFKGKKVRLAEVAVFYDPEGICGIMSSYMDECDLISQGGSTLFPLDKRSTKRIVLEEKEKIVEVSGSLKPGIISYLMLKTNKEKVLEVGEATGTPFANQIKSNRFLAGFGGFVNKYLEFFYVYQSRI